MNNLPKFALAFQGVPASQEEDYLNVYGSTTEWRDGEIRSYNWGRCSTIYIAHQRELVPVYYDDLDEENKDKAGQPTGEYRDAVRAMAITVPNPVTREKLFQEGIHQIYQVNGYEEQLAFAQKMLNGAIDSPESEEMGTYKEVSSWLNWQLDIWEGLTLEAAKNHILSDIDAYDTSSSVNEFFLEIAGEKYSWWVDRNTRISLKNSTTIQMEEQRSRGVETPDTIIWYNGISLDLPCEMVLQMLNALEMYALGCYSVTAQHQSAVKALESVEEVLGYDYTTGYPEKLTFTIPVIQG